MPTYPAHLDHPPTTLTRIVHKARDSWYSIVDGGRSLAINLVLAILQFSDTLASRPTIALAGAIGLGLFGIVAGGLIGVILGLPAAAVIAILSARALSRWNQTNTARKKVEASSLFRERSFAPGTPLDSVDLGGATPEEIRRRLETENEIVLREFSGNASTEDGSKKSRVYLVARNNGAAPGVLAKKVHSRDDRFYREVAALLQLKDVAGVARIAAVDSDEKSIYMLPVTGETIESMRLKQRKQDLEVGESAPARKARQVRGILSDDCRARAAKTLHDIHSNGICQVDLHYSNLMISDPGKSPVFLDFGQAKTATNPDSIAFFHRRSVECQRFNKIFDSSFPEPDTIRLGIQKFVADRENLPWYSGVNFGYGITAGNVGSIESGRRKWNFILHRHLKDIEGKRLLDLGCNNSNVSMQALLAGASEVVGVELDPFYAGQARFVGNTFSWIHQRTLPITIHDGSITDVRKMNLGRFDIVFALNCLYYLESDELAELLADLRGMTERLLVQCNVSGQFSTPELNHKASLNYNIEHLEDAGFEIETIDAPPFFFRPLIVARNSSTT